MFGSMASKVGVVILAAGTSARLGRDKIFLPLSGKPLVAWSLEICQKSACINQIVLVIHESTIDRSKKYIQKMHWDKITDICSGGERRQDSVKAGLKRLVSSFNPNHLAVLGNNCIRPTAPVWDNAA